MTVVRPLALLLTTLLTLSGCSLLLQKPVPLYQPDSGSAVTPAKDNGMAVLVGPVSIADYLRQEHLLQRQADGSLVAARDARWASGRACSSRSRLLLISTYQSQNSDQVNSYSVLAASLSL